MTNAADAVAGRVFGDDAADQCRLGSNTEPTAGAEQPASVLGVIADDRATDELGFCPGPWGARSVVPDKHAAAVARAAVLRDRAVEEGGAAVRDRDAAAVTVDSAAGNDQGVKDDQPCYARRWSTPDHFKDAALLLGVNRDGRCAIWVGFAAERDVGGAEREIGFVIRTRRNVDDVVYIGRVDCVGDGGVVPRHVEHRSFVDHPDGANHARAAMGIAEVRNGARCIGGYSPREGGVASVQRAVEQAICRAGIARRDRMVAGGVLPIDGVT